ncbi:class I adenylate-forming enzyme family protein [Pseudonocardia parietis]|uniref:Acyl-CoA synthetase (AMP-forming)/AMP-acid ligase II n=1 Tax=Pseudonocardia parietis TaxID=570936 RepID=A0ABS4VM38_9PSEU|nr:AMP-binding protein [Pseudonocardia parietis]MBP2364808.1 acyl-CoA synthetase (AMP-forming)/AMP-acid ligase II [Pseudonocardia parietis]
MTGGARPVNPAEVLRRNAEECGDDVALICGDTRQTHRELHERARKLVHVLRRAGIEQGERVALLVDNGPASLELLAGVTLGGFVRCPLYTHDLAERHRYLLDLTESAALIIEAKYYPALEPALRESATVRTVIVMGEQPGVPGYERLMTEAPADPVEIDLDPEAPYQIRFSAGTTGFPKGILHSLRGWMAVGAETLAGIEPALNHEDRYLAAGPLSHAAGVPVWPVLTAGGAIVVMPSFDVGEFVELVERERVTLSVLVATMVQMITRHPDVGSRDLSSLRLVLYGASPIPESVLVDALELWGNIMHQSYGQSEAIPVAALLPEHHIVDGTPAQRRWLRSAGRATPSSGIRIVDDADRELPAGEIGEITVHSPGRMVEIWRDPEATAARITPDGWVRTRDMGWLDEDGFLYLADRKEDMIISGGFNIWPAELENALTAHPGVREAAVVGIPHPKWGETPYAEIVRDERHDDEVSEAELIDWTRQRLGSVKKVTSVRFVDELPRTPVGKVLRRVVRERATT